jgi:hypothetical protein
MAAEKLYVPETIIPVTCDYGVVYADLSASRDYYGIAIGENASAVFRIVNDTGDVEDVCSYFQQKYPDKPLGTTRSMAGQSLKSLFEIGLIAATDENPPPRTLASVDIWARRSFTDISEPPGPEDMIPLSRQEHRLALGALKSVLGMGKLSTQKRITFFREQRASASTPASYEEAVQAMLAIDSVRNRGRNKFKRIACLEMSAAALVYASRAMDRKVNMHLGFAFDPIHFHAWPTAEGEPVRILDDPQINGVYHSLYEI